MDSATFKFSEARVAEQLGISRDAIRDVRAINLEPGLDWKKISGEILLTHDAVGRVVKLTFTQMPDLELCLPQPKSPQVPNGEHPLRKKMRVIPPRPFNPRVVFAQDAEGNRQLVWVGRNDTFCFDDEIEVEPHETQTGILQCVSPVPRDRRRR
jgi:hypothetical protein